MNLVGRFIIDGYDLYEAFKVVVQEAYYPGKLGARAGRADGAARDPQPLGPKSLGA